MTLAAALDMPPSRSRSRVDREAGLLRGTRCRNCGADSWPARSICQRCGQATLEFWDFGPTGVLITHTEVWTPRPGLDVPYRLGQVRLDDGPLVFTHVRELREGEQVPLPVRIELAERADAVPPFWFVPAGDR